MKRIFIIIITTLSILITPASAASATIPPDTLGSSGWVEYELTELPLYGSDIFWGYDSSSGIHISNPQIWDSGISEWNDLPSMVEIISTYEYLGADTWGVLSIGELPSALIRLYVDIPWAGLEQSTGDYIFGFKQTELTLSEYFNNGWDDYTISSWDVEWTNVKEVVFNNPGAELMNQTVILTIDDDDIDWLNVQIDGDDIRFIDNDNATVLDFEIKAWNYSDSATFWVNVPAIDGSSDYDSILFYYGNDIAISGEASGLADELTVNYTYVDISTNPPANITYEVIDDNRVSLSWDKGYGTHNTYIVRKLGSPPASITDGTVVYYGPEKSCIDTGAELGLFLSTNTYYYRAWSENVLGGHSTDYAQKEVTGIMSVLILTLGISAFAFWKREVWLYIIAAIAMLFFSYSLFETNLYIAIAPFILTLYMLIRAATAWYASRRE